MNVNRIAILGLALVAGGAAFFLMMSNQQPEQGPVRIVEPVKEETVRVLVAGRIMVRGERFTPEDTQWVAWPKKAVRPGFITDENPEARDSLSEAVARSMMVEGEPVVEAKIVRSGSAGLMAALLSPGMRAVTVRVTPETSSGGFILPGDRVDIHYAERDDNDQVRLTPVNENIRVLAINTAYIENPEVANIDGNNVTLEMTPQDAEYLIAARNSRGSIQLTLRSIFEPETAVAQPRRKEIQVIRYGRS